MDSPDSQPPWLTIPDMLAENGVRFAAKTAIIDRDIHLTYGDLLDQTRKLSRSMKSMGVRPGDKVGLWGGNSWRWVVAAAACWWCGCIVVPISARAKLLDGLPLVAGTDIKTLFADYSALDLDCETLDQQGLARKIDLGASEQKAVDGVTSWETLFCGGCSAGEPVRVAPDDICQILYTSGTTSEPKGVIKRHAQIIINRSANSIRRNFTSEDILLGLPPFSHSLGLNGNLLRCLMLGACLVIPDRSTPREIAGLINDHRISVVNAPPTLLETLLDIDPSEITFTQNLRLVSVGSAAISPQLIQRLFDRGIPEITSGYGMTECDTICSATKKMGVEVLANTVGIPEPGLEVRIVDPDGSEVLTDDVGEIQVRGYSTTSGYYKQPALTRQLYDRDDWMRTGDLGRWLPTGHLQIMGRKKDVIICHGYNLYPPEIESLLMQSRLMEAIAVFGVENSFGGEQSIAAVVPRTGKLFSTRKLRRWAKSNIADYKFPTQFIEVERLPLNGNGKLDRVRLREDYLSDKFGETGK